MPQGPESKPILPGAQQMSDAPNRIQQTSVAVSSPDTVTVADQAGRRPILPAQFVAIAAALVPITGTVAVILPPPWSWICAVLALILAGLAGVALPQPRWAAQSKAAAPALTAGVAALVSVAEVLPEPWSWIAYSAACVVAGLAGMAAPQPLRKRAAG